MRMHASRSVAWCFLAVAAARRWQPDVQVDDRARRSRRRRARQGRQLRPRPDAGQHHHLRERQAAEDPAVLHGDARPGADRRRARAASTPTTPQSGAHRVFVMLFDEAHLSNDSLMRVKDGRGGVRPRHVQRRRRRRRVPQRRHVQGPPDHRQGRAARRHPRRAAGVREPPGDPRAVPAVAAHRRAKSRRCSIADGAREVVERLGAAGLPGRSRRRAAAKAASATSRT